MEKEIKNFIKHLKTLSPNKFAKYIYENFDCMGTDCGLYFESDKTFDDITENINFKVRFNNEDIIDFLDLDPYTDPESVYDEYILHEDKVALHFIAQQKFNIIKQIEDNLE